MLGAKTCQEGVKRERKRENISGKSGNKHVSATHRFEEKTSILNLDSLLLPFFLDTRYVAILVACLVN